MHRQAACRIGNLLKSESGSPISQAAGSGLIMAGGYVPDSRYR